jgi:hypothetical protein
MSNKYISYLVIVISVCAALFLASAQEGNLAEAALAEDMIDEIASANVVDSANETATAELSPEVELVVTPEGPMSDACPMIIVPVVEDLYVDLAEAMVYNDDHLVCEYLMGNRYNEDEFPGMVMIQFDISDIEIQEDDVAILVLKAESIEKVGDDVAGLFLMPITSEWSENSSATALALNMLSIMITMSDGDDFDFSQFGMNFGEGEVFVFDVLEHLKAADGGRISFILMAAGDTDYKVSFKSRETDEGPCLLIAPYPSVPVA